MSREDELRMGVMKLSHEDELQRGVTKLSHKDESQRGGHKNKKIQGICNRYPKESKKLIKNKVQNKYVV